MSQLKPEQQRLLKQRLHDNPVFAQQFAAFRNSGDMDRAAKHLCIAYQLFTLANEHAETAYEGFAFDNQILSEVIEAYLSNKEIVIKRGPYLAPTLFLPSK